VNRSPALYRSRQHHSTRLDLLVLACVLTLIACDSTAPIEKNLFFEGTISDAATGAPIAGASISVGDGHGFVPAIVKSTTSDAQGRYTLAHFGCIFTPYVFAGAAGYFDAQEAVGCKPGTQTVNFSLSRNPQAP
jgi:hypothetical protein